MSVPKIAVLATALAVGVAVATINPAPAQATPRASACTGCHGSGASITATAPTTSLAPGATYQVRLSANEGYWITGPSVSVFGGSSTSVNVTAPAAAGTYTYTVYVRNGNGGSTTYSITVAAVVTTTTTTTRPPTTTTTTTTPPPTTTTTTRPPTTTTTTTPPVTTTTPPVTTTTPPVTTTTPPVTTTTPPVTTTTPPVSGARISRLSPDEGQVGTTVTIRGTGFGKAGVVKFGTVTAQVKSWTSTKIVVKAPRVRGEEVDVTVTPKGATASNGFEFQFEGHDGDDDGDDGDSRHSVRLGVSLD